jgi:Alpha-glutamyl/putrescinyl thymine pyrophosphorylase clade 3
LLTVSAQAAEGARQRLSPTGTMPTFCRHNRFIERCPICSRTLPGYASETSASRRAGSARAPAGEKLARRRAPRSEGMRVHREGRAEQDGYSSQLIPGVHASADARRLAQELAFSSARLDALAEERPGLYGEVSALAAQDIERATWIGFLIAYLSPLQGEDPFAGIRLALSRGSGEEHAGGELPDLTGVPLGPRTSHDPARGSETLLAYRQWVQRTAGSGGQARALSGDPSWSPERRFERVFERLALPGFGRMGRYELLLMLGRLGLYELRPDSLHLGGASGLSASDMTTVAAKRVFAIGDPLLLERRARTLAEEASLPIETLDLALANWASPQPATLGFPADISDSAALERAAEALGV